MAEEVRDDLQSMVIEAKTGYRTYPQYDFSLPSELTVTITLNEYRALILAKGDYEKKFEEKDKIAFERYKEIEKLKEENANLKEKLCDLIEHLPSKEDVEEESTEEEE